MAPSVWRMMQYTKYKMRPKRWMQFSLKSFFAFATVFMVVSSWFAVQIKWVRDRHNALHWIESTQDDPPFYGGTVGGIEPPFPDDDRTPWTLRLLGEKGVGMVLVDDHWLGPSAPYSLDELRRLFPEAEVIAISAK
jgi:hypothetical protein